MTPPVNDNRCSNAEQTPTRPGTTLFACFRGNSIPSDGKIQQDFAQLFRVAATALNDRVRLRYHCDTLPNRATSRTNDVHVDTGVGIYDNVQP
jgi:hypothetical protein